MKQFLGFFILAYCASLPTTAQINKGSILLGGQISYASTNANYGTSQPNQKNKNGLFNISVGKTIKENSVLGISLAYGSSKGENNYNGSLFMNLKVNQYAFEVYYRLYKKLAKNFYFFGEFGGGYITSNQTDKDTSGNNKVKYSQTGGDLYLTPGLSYKILKKLQVEILIPRIVDVRYTVSKTKSQTENFKENQFIFNTNLNPTSLSFLGVGFSYIF